MKLIISTLIFLGGILTYFAHQNINYLLFKDNLSLLTSSSSILFAILGVWIALLYPEEFKDLKNGKNDHSERFKDLKILVNSMVLCVITICSILIVSFCAPYLKKYINFNNLYIFQYINTIFLLIVTITQIYCYLTILLPTTAIDNQLETEKHKKKLMEKFSPEDE